MTSSQPMLLPALQATPSTVVDRVDHLAQLRAKRRIDALLRRESQGRFRSMEQLTTTPGYTPTLRNATLADAYDAAQARRNDPRRACR